MKGLPAPLNDVWYAPRQEDNYNHGDRNGGHLIGYGGLISVPVAQQASVAAKREDLRKYENEVTVRVSLRWY